MVLQTIYIVRHGARTDFWVDPATGIYQSRVPSATGLPADPPLTSHGIDQAKDLAKHMATISPPVDVIYASPFYRILQTLWPVVESLNAGPRKADQLSIHIEPGLSEYFGTAEFEQPAGPDNALLAEMFPTLTLADTEPLIRPNRYGESISAIHDRFAYCIQQIIRKLDADPTGPSTLLIGTHAAALICLGRVLTGRMPDDYKEADFKCFTCCLSKFERRRPEEAPAPSWSAETPNSIPAVEWRGGRGVGGGWDCVLNGDCSHLTDGAENTWIFNA